MNSNYNVKSDDGHKHCLDEEGGIIDTRRQAVEIVIAADNDHHDITQEQEKICDEKEGRTNHGMIQEDKDDGKSLMKIRMQTLDYVERSEELHRRRMVEIVNDDPIDHPVEEGPVVTLERAIPDNLKENHINDDKMTSYETSLNDGEPRRRESRPGALAVYPSGQPTTLSIGDDTYDNLSTDTSDCTSESIMSISEELQDGQRVSMTKPLSNPLISVVVDDLEDLEKAVQERIERRTVMATNVTNATNNRTNTDDQEDETTQKRHFVKLLLLGIIFMIVCSVTLAAIFLTSKFNGDSSELSQSPSMSPSNSTSPIDLLRKMLLPISGPELLYDESTAQYRALEWLANEDAYLPTLLKDTDGNLTYDEDELSAVSRQLFRERYVIVSFYFATNGPNWETDLKFLSNSSVCEWPEINEWEDGDLTNAIRCDELSGLVNYIRLGKHLLF